jgi:hypothetical protein
VTSLAHDPAAKGRAAELTRQMLGRRQSTAQLLQHNQALRRELSNLFLVSKRMRIRANRWFRAPGPPATDIELCRQLLAAAVLRSTILLGHLRGTAICPVWATKPVLSTASDYRSALARSARNRIWIAVR